MCTASWLIEADGYELFCNRDESKMRQPAAPPALRERLSVKFLAPADGDFGGSWISVNEFGLSLCLLNFYPAVTQHASPTSRGLLVV